MPRKLNAIEIAEGALLADIAVVFQLLAVYIPFAGPIFSLLIPTVFAILVLRRNLYTGIMAFWVAFFLVNILTGGQFVILLFWECGAGLYLGLTMKHRLPHLFIILFGLTSASILVYVMFFALAFVGGLPLSQLAQTLHDFYDQVLPFLATGFSLVGLGDWWKSSWSPPLDAFAQFVFLYWWFFFYIYIWSVLLPVVIIVYYITNVFVRLLGYTVTPFPGGKIEKLAYLLLRRLYHRKSWRKYLIR